MYSAPLYPQSNEQAEATNKTLFSALKKRLEKAKGRWVDELLRVLLAYQTMPGRPTGTTLFVFTYGMEAVILIEIGMPTARTTVQGQRYEYLELERHLEWANEVRRNAAIRMASYQQRAIGKFDHVPLI